MVNKLKFLDKSTLSVIGTLLLIISLFPTAITFQEFQNKHSTAYAATSTQTYFVDSQSGNDSNDGKSDTKAWKSLDKVNSFTFKPGDHILFKAGGVWNGQLYPKGSGNSNAYIYIDMYGLGGSKPLINGGGNTTGAVYLFNQPYWEIRNLEVTNTGSSRDEYVGIKVRTSTPGQLNHVYIGNCIIHDVNGIYSGNYATNGGIAVVSDAPTSKWNDVKIENNIIYKIDRIGIHIGATWLGAATGNVFDPNALRTSNVIIQNNTISDSGGDAIMNFLTSHVTVQHNVAYDNGSRAYQTEGKNTGYTNVASVAIWSASADNTTIQFNEVYNENAPGAGPGYDAQAYDIDWGNNHIKLQYNYSHDNIGGFMIIVQDRGNVINDAIVRYNISSNDKWTIFCFADTLFPTGQDKLQIYNNTIYIPEGIDNQIFRQYNDKTDPITGTGYIRNNIFYVLGTTAYVSMPEAVFDSNIFYGNHPASEPNDPHKLTSDPLFVAPGTAGIGRANVKGYKLQTTSPAIKSGVLIPNNGGMDYWGNEVSRIELPSRGAYNGEKLTFFCVGPGLNNGDCVAKAESAGPTDAISPTNTQKKQCDQYNLNNPLKKNFGDPNCDFTKDSLFKLLRQLDPVNADRWFNTIIPCGSAYNPNAYTRFGNNPDDPAGAW